MPTLQDIAKIVGVSSATVSLALADHPRISDETKAKIRKTAIDIGYTKFFRGDVVQTNPKARSRSIGVLYLGAHPQSMNHGFFKDCLMGICQEAGRIDRNVVMLGIQTEGQSADPEAIAEEVVRSGAEGVVVLSTQPNLYGLDKLVERGYPMVFIGSRTIADRKVRLHSVATDLHDAARMGLDYLIGLGHARIAILMGEANVSRWSEQLPRHDEAEVKAFLVSSPFDAREKGWGELTAYAPTAIFSTSVPLGHAAMNYLRASGKRVPEEVSLISYDDSVSYSYETPPITAIKQNLESIGRQSAKMLLDLLENPDQSPTQVLLSTQLVERASCAPPKSV